MCWLSRCGLESHLFPYVLCFVRLLCIYGVLLQPVRLPTKPVNWATQRRELQSSARIWSIRLCFSAKSLWTRPWCNHQHHLIFSISLSILLTTAKFVTQRWISYSLRSISTYQSSTRCESFYFLFSSLLYCSVCISIELSRVIKTSQRWGLNDFNMHPA